MRKCKVEENKKYEGEGCPECECVVPLLFVDYFTNVCSNR